MIVDATPDPISRGVITVERIGDGVEAPDVYFRPAYLAADASRWPAAWTIVHAYAGQWQIPLIIREVEGGGVDAASPYGYSGVYAAPSLTTAETSAAWRDTLAALRALGIIAVTLRHSPMVPQATRYPEQMDVVSGHPTRVLRVTDVDAAWTGLAGRARTAVRKARKVGLRSSVRPATSDDLRAGSAFRTLYEQTMSRRAASLDYLFSDRYFDTLHTGLGSDLLIVQVDAPDGRMGAAALLMRHGSRLHYHLSASEPAAARDGANNLLLWAAIGFAHETGLRDFHLGGGVRGRDSLYEFKRSFGGTDLEYSMTGVILNQDLYDRKSAEALGVISHTRRQNAVPQYFPAYRAPGVVSTTEPSASRT